MKIIIGSNNPAKVAAVKNAFHYQQTEFLSLDIPSGVSEQPFSDEETIKGAINRAVGALKWGMAILALVLREEYRNPLMVYYCVIGVHLHQKIWSRLLPVEQGFFYLMI